ncbi:MAG TPA: YggT family protein [Polyangiaceae bacterium]|jgi:uncharacterized protein YggT (Ycf19 family)
MATTILGHYGRRHDSLLRVAAVFDFLFGILYLILGIRLLLVLFDARQGAGFVRFINQITEPFYAPFRGIVANGSIEAHPIAWPLVVAIVAYAVLHAIIRALLRVADRA